RSGRTGACADRQNDLWRAFALSFQNSTSSAGAGAESIDQRLEPKPVAVILGDCAVSLWGLTATERLKRSFKRAGVTDCRTDGDPLPRSGKVVLVRADYLFEERLIRDLVT